MSIVSRIDRRSFLLATGGVGVAGAIALATRAAGSQRTVVAEASAKVVAPSSASRDIDSDGSHPFGIVKPRRAAPTVSLVAADGSELALSTWLVGRPTAVQLMFTRCTSTCPIQGALFGAVADQLPSGTRLLSISIDPEHDTPPALRAWVARYSKHSDWFAATPRDQAGADLMFNFLRGRTDALDKHSLQVFMFDARGQFTYRTNDLPSPTEVSAVLRRLV